jgi:hypothetical protein
VSHRLATRRDTHTQRDSNLGASRQEDTPEEEAKRKRVAGGLVGLEHRHGLVAAAVLADDKHAKSRGGGEGSKQLCCAYLAQYQITTYVNTPVEKE